MGIDMGVDMCIEPRYSLQGTGRKVIFRLDNLKDKRD